MRSLKITSVEPGSTASEMGLAAGYEILSINGAPVPDYLAYKYLVADADVTLLVKKPGGELVEYEVEKDEDDDLGIVPEPMRLKRCNNKCVFCFVSQMPRGLRKTLYVKDEDFRHSFMFGNYITLTTLTDEDYARIIGERLSPLYVSVHATDDAVRRALLKNPKAAPILESIRRLTGGGITVHAQAVVCPGINDDGVLMRTVEELAALHPGVASLAVVPVGLTAHRERLYPLKGFTRAGARRLIEGLEPMRRRYRRRLGVRFVYPADELYIKAGMDFPPEREYDGYPQIDNGVGLVRDFISEFAREKRRLPRALKEPMHVLLVTGVSFAPILKSAVKPLAGIKGLRLGVFPVKNRLFGDSVTVAGLLPGLDIAQALKGSGADAALVPAVAVREGEGVFLDDMDITDVERVAGMRVTLAEPNARGLVEAIRNIV